MSTLTRTTQNCRPEAINSQAQEAAQEEKGGKDKKMNIYKYIFTFRDQIYFVVVLHSPRLHGTCYEAQRDQTFPPDGPHILQLLFPTPHVASLKSIVLGTF